MTKEASEPDSSGQPVLRLVGIPESVGGPETAAGPVAEAGASAAGSSPAAPVPVVKFSLKAAQAFINAALQVGATQDQVMRAQAAGVDRNTLLVPMWRSMRGQAVAALQTLLGLPAAAMASAEIMPATLEAHRERVKRLVELAELVPLPQEGEEGVEVLALRAYVAETRKGLGL